MSAEPEKGPACPSSPSFFLVLFSLFARTEAAQPQDPLQFLPWYLHDLLMAGQAEAPPEKEKWRGAASGVVSAPVARVWELVSATSRLREWMPMVESCNAVAGEEGAPGFVRLVTGGLMFPQQLQTATASASASWVRERLVAMDHAARSYTYEMEDGNVGLAGSRNTVSLFDYGDGEAATLVLWSFEIDPVDGANRDALLDYLRILYNSCIHNICIPSSS